MSHDADRRNALILANKKAVLAAVLVADLISIAHLKGPMGMPNLPPMTRSMA